MKAPRHAALIWAMESVDHFRRQSTDLLLAAVDQSGLQSQGHYVAGDEHHVGLDRAVRGLTCEVIDLGFVPERVPQRVLQPFCNVKRGEYGLDNVCILYRSKTAAKTDHGRSLGLDRGWRIAFKGCQLAFDIVQKSRRLTSYSPVLLNASGASCRHLLSHGRKPSAFCDT